MKSIDNEKAIIHECLNDPNKLEEAIQQLNENDFLDPNNRTIFKAIKEIAMQNRTPSFISVTQHIENGKDQFNGSIAEYLSEIVSNILLNTYDNFSYFIETQKSEAEAYRQLYVLKEAEKMISNKSSNAEVTDYVVSSFTNMENKRVSGLTHISEALKKLSAEYENGKTRGYNTGFPTLDYLTGGFKKGQMIVLGANTGIGKTSLAFSIACNIAKKNSVLYVSREMSASEMASRFIALNTDIKMQSLNNCSLSVIDLAKINDLQKKDSKMFIDTHSSKVAEIYATSLKLKRNDEDLGLIVIDYLQLLDYGEYSNNDTQALDRLTRDIKVLAMRLEVPVLVLSQFNNMASGETLKLKHLRGSGSISQNADIVLFIDRNIESLEDNDRACLIIAKGRNIGRGIIKLRFNGDKTEYLEIDEFFGL